jgi:hypothetical protein
MGRPRAFDWDEAQRLHDVLGTYTAVARVLGVAAQSVRCALDPVAREERRRRQSEDRPWLQPCKGGCGGLATQYGARSGMCVACLVKAKAEGDVRPGELRCRGECGRWLPDDWFAKGHAAVRRYRRTECTECDTKRRRAYRQQLGRLEAERAYDRDRKRRSRRERLEVLAALGRQGKLG